MLQALKNNNIYTVKAKMFITYAYLCKTVFSNGARTCVNKKSAIEKNPEICVSFKLAI